MNQRITKIISVILLIVGVLCTSAVAVIPVNMQTQGQDKVEDAPSEDGDGDLTPPADQEDEPEQQPEMPKAEEVQEAKELEQANIEGDELAEQEDMLAEPAKEPIVPTTEEVASLLNRISAYQKNTVKNPGIGTEHGEWTVLGLARHGSMTDSFKQRYIKNVTNTVLDKDGVLDKRKYTEYSRVAIALTAIGEDPRNVAGYNLLQALAEFENTTWQGVNGAMWALIALDTKGYDIPKVQAAGQTQTTKEQLIAEILRSQTADGGWRIGGSGHADMDVTGMGLQALAPYYRSRADVRAAVDRALDLLSTKQEMGGGWAESMESTVQVFVGLQALNIPLLDSRFVKEGNTSYDGIMQYYVAETGGFCHILGGGINSMATDQGMYALVALQRQLTGANRLYDMTDVPFNSTDDSQKREEVTKAIRALPKDPGIAYKKEINYLQVQLNSLQDFKNKEEYQSKLKRLLKIVQKKEQTVSRLDRDIWEQVDLLRISHADKERITKLMQRYHSIAAEDRKHLRHAGMLKDAGDILGRLEQRIIPKQLFDNNLGKNTMYGYEDPAGYTLSFKGTDITAPKDMNAVVTLGGSGPSTLLKQAYWIRFAEQGQLPATITLRASTGQKNGTYTLYRYNAVRNQAQKRGEYTAEGGNISFSVTMGGDYFLLPTSSAGGGAKFSAAQLQGGAGAIQQATQKDGKLSKETFEQIMGEDVNIVYEGTSGEDTSYRLTFNGEEIVSAIEMDPELLFAGANEQYIKRIADGRYQYLRFKHEGALPGKALVEVETQLEDGAYILFAYDAQQMRAIATTEVQVEDGWAMFFITEGGEYFIAKRARKASIYEMDAKIEDTAEEMITSVEQEQPASINKAEAALPKEMSKQSNNTPFIILLIVLVAAVCGGVWLYKRKKRQDADTGKTQ